MSEGPIDPTTPADEEPVRRLVVRGASPQRTTVRDAAIVLAHAPQRRVLLPVRKRFSMLAALGAMFGFGKDVPTAPGGARVKSVKASAPRARRYAPKRKNGARECARRVRQLQTGHCQLTPITYPSDSLVAHRKRTLQAQR